MSSVIAFSRQNLRSSANIPTILTPQRQCMLPSTGRMTTWANALERLLAQRRGRLKKGQLAKLAGMRPGNISAVLNKPNPPNIQTLMRIVDALTAFDRRGNPTAPAVELWEFFVTDEQAEALRSIADAQAEAVRKVQTPTVADSFSQIQSALTTLQQQLEATAAHAPKHKVR